MNPALIPLLSKIGEKIIERVAGDKTAKLTSVAGGSVVAATASIDPGLLLFPDDPQNALVANSVLYLVGLILLAIRGKARKYEPFKK